MKYKIPGKSFFLAFFMLLMTASFVRAEVHIFEVQVHQPPGVLVIYGTMFGDNPVINLGTQVAPLVIAADQSLCSATPPPPLNPVGIDCVVAELPDPIPDGDYLLWLEGEEVQGCFEDCNQAPSSLTFMYTGGTCAASSNTQTVQNPCVDNGVLGDPASVTCVAQNAPDCAADTNPVAVGGTTTITASKLNPEIIIDIDGGNQVLTIHTSCSQPLAVGDVFGSMSLVGMTFDSGSCSGTRSAHYDLTIGAQGDQGPQGKQGDPGDQGIQGKKGDQGDQGIQGKKGDQGDQGIQGKKGDQGDQGIQGKKGDKGDQGIQGKKGDQGDQGIQGKKGDQGDQGIQGKKGDKGDQGIQGKKGDQGDQGIQGKKGDQGIQGIQGKKGDQGDQGIQGKKGDQGIPGIQGIQGKKGDQGDQGIQGKKGDQGDQGIQGKIGPEGPQGPQGPGGVGSGLVCFSTDQTVGATGKFIGLGTQGGSHDEVSVITPFSAADESTVLQYACKMAQGNTARSGLCKLFHDDPNGSDFGEELGSCLITPADPKETTSTCMVMINGGAGVVLAEKDSMSIFAETDGGSFEGVSACAVLVRGADN